MSAPPFGEPETLYIFRAAALQIRGKITIAQYRVKVPRQHGVVLGVRIERCAARNLRQRPTIGAYDGNTE